MSGIVWALCDYLDMGRGTTPRPKTSVRRGDDVMQGLMRQMAGPILGAGVVLVHAPGTHPLTR